MIAVPQKVEAESCPSILAGQRFFVKASEKFPVLLEVTLLVVPKGSGSTLSSPFATTDLLDAPRICHDTVPSCRSTVPHARRRGTFSSSTKQPKNSATISRSELVIAPCEFSQVIKASLVFCGQSTCQTIGARICPAATYLPPPFSGGI